MTNPVRLKSWEIRGNQAELTYEDGDTVYVNKDDFNRAFGPIVSGDKSAIIRDFGVAPEEPHNITPEETGANTGFGFGQSMM